MFTVYYLTNENNLFTDSEEIIQDDVKVIKLKDVNIISEFLDRNKDFAVDLETTGLDPYIYRPASIQLGTKQEALVIPLSIIKGTNLFPIWYALEDKTRTKYFQNAKFDYNFIRHHYGVITQNIWDTMIAEQVIFAGYTHREYSLAGLVETYLNIELDKSQKSGRYAFVGVNLDREVGMGTKEIIYGALDVRYLIHIAENQHNLMNTFNLKEVIDLELSLIPAYADIEYNGIFIDPKYWKEKIINFYTDKLNYIEDTLDGIIQKDLNLNKKYINKSYQLDLFTGLRSGRLCTINYSSSDQLKVLFQDDLGLDITLVDKEKNKTTTSTSAVILEKLADKHVVELLDTCDYDNLYTYIDGKETVEFIPSLIMYHRHCSSLLDKYGEKMLKCIHPMTNRIHPSIQQCGTTTGRISQKNPNLQNPPSIERFRTGFKAQKKDSVYICADYSGIELRIVAEGSDEPVFIQAFKDNKDLHSVVASELFGIEVSKTKNAHLRATTKFVNFGIIYGASADKIAELTGLNLEDAKNFLDQYFKKYKNLKVYIDKQNEKARRNANSRTFYPINRVRWYPEVVTCNRLLSQKDAPISEKEYAIRTISKIGREGVNHPIQGTSADMIKIATRNIKNFIDTNYSYTDIRIVNQIHDELILEVVNESIAQEILPTIKKLMIQAGEVQLKKVPVDVEIGISKYWKK